MNTFSQKNCNDLDNEIKLIVEEKAFTNKVKQKLLYSNYI